jgi:hypothetical protein
MQGETLLYEIENVNVLYTKKPDVTYKKAEFLVGEIRNSFKHKM